MCVRKIKFVSSQVHITSDKSAKKSDFKIVISVILNTAMTRYDHYTFRKVLKIKIFFMCRSRMYRQHEKGSDVFGLVLGF